MSGTFKADYGGFACHHRPKLITAILDVIAVTRHAWKPSMRVTFRSDGNHQQRVGSET